MIDPALPMLKLWREGDRDSAAHRNEVLNLINTSRLGVMPPQQSTAIPIGTFESQEFKLVVVRVDYLLCVTRDGTGGQISVALPWMLQRSPFDGKTRGDFSYVYNGNSKRTSTAPDATTEEQELTPSYLFDDIIFATFYSGLSFSINDGERVTSWRAEYDRQWAAV